MADVPGVGHGHRELGLEQGGDHGALVASGGFDHDERRPRRAQGADERGDIHIVIRARGDGLRVGASNIQGGLGDIDPDQQIVRRGR